MQIIQGGELPIILRFRCTTEERLPYFHKLQQWREHVTIWTIHPVN